VNNEETEHQVKARAALLEWAVARRLPGAELAKARGYGATGIVCYAFNHALETAFPGRVSMVRRFEAIDWKRRNDPSVVALEIESKFIEVVQAFGLPDIESTRPDNWAELNPTDEPDNYVRIHGICRCVIDGRKLTAACVEVLTADNWVMFVVDAELLRSASHDAIVASWKATRRLGSQNSKRFAQAVET
jgi:hypothetical protein